MAATEPHEVVVIDWNVNPFRAERWYELWLPAAERALSYGATRWSITRSTENPLLFRQTIAWRDRADFERYWASEELSTIRRRANGLHGIPVLPVWHTYLAGEAVESASETVAEASVSG